MYLIFRYIPPLASSNPNLPDNIDEISIELRKQESLLLQIHAEMNAGFISKKREEQLWEVQRIITQLKRKMKNYERKIDKHFEETIDEESNNQPFSSSSSITTTTAILHDINSSLIFSKSKPSISDEESSRAGTMESFLNSETKISPDIQSFVFNQDSSGIRINESGMLILPESHLEYWALMRLQLENEELMKWKNSLKIKIHFERAETLRLKKILADFEDKSSTYAYNSQIEELDHGRVVDHFIKENALLEHKRNMLVCEIFEETKELLQLQVELSMKSLNVQ